MKKLFIIFLLGLLSFPLQADEGSKERNKAFFDGFWLHEKYSASLLIKKYFEYEYQFIEKTYIEGPPTHQFSKGKVNKKFVLGTDKDDISKLRFIKFDNVYNFEDVMQFYKLFCEKFEEADIAYTKDYFWTKGFRAEWIRDDGKTTEILDATYRQGPGGDTYEVSHYFFENSYTRSKEDLKVPHKADGIVFEAYGPENESVWQPVETTPIVRNREIEKASDFKLILGGIDLTKNLSYDSIPNALPGAEITSSLEDFEKYKYVAFKFNDCAFELEYYFEEDGKASTVYLRNIEIDKSHEILNEILQSRERPFLAFTKQYKLKVRQPENWLYYVNEDTKKMAVFRLSEDFIDKNRFQIAIDMREYEDLPELPKETPAYIHKLMKGY